MPKNSKVPTNDFVRPKGIFETPPLPRTKQAISRPELIAEFEKASNRRLIVLCDIAGSGKTTAVLGWVNTRIPVGDHIAWLGLTADDNDLNNFLFNLCDVFEQLGAPVSKNTRNLLISAPVSPAKSVLENLCKAISSFDQRIILVLDDLQSIKSPTVSTAIEWFVHNAPASVRFVFTTREKVELKISRLRALDQVFEFARGALRFTTPEIRRFLETQLVNAEFTTDDVDQIANLTNGWPVALQFIVLSYRQSGNPDPRKLISNTSGGLFSFLKEDVLERMAKEDANALVYMACLPKISPEAVTAMIGLQNAEAKLVQLADQGFLRVENSNEFRFFHPLFHQFLENELAKIDETELQELRDRASEFYLRKGDHQNAMDQLIKAGNFDKTAQILETEGMNLLRASRIQELSVLLKKVPEEVLNASPRLEMYWIWILFHLPHTDVAMRRLVTFRRKVRNGQFTAERLGLSDDDLETELRVLTAGVLSANGRSTLARQSVLASMRALRHRTDFKKGTLFNILAYSEIILGDVSSAREASRLGYENHKRDDSVFGVAYAELLTGVSEIELCRPYKAANSLRRGIDYVIQNVGPGSYPEALLSMAIAETHYGWNQLEDAESVLRPVLSVVRESGSLLFLQRAALLEAKLHMASKKSKMALQTLNDLEAKGARSFPLSMRHCILDERVRILLAKGDVVSARIALKTANIDPDEPSTVPVENLTIGAISAQLAKSRLLIAEGRFNEAVSTLEVVREDAVARERQMTLITIEGLIAIALHNNGARLKAADMLMETMRIVSSEAVTRSLIDLGPEIASVLTDARDKFRLIDRRPDLMTYCSSLIRFFDVRPEAVSAAPDRDDTSRVPSDPELLEPLTGREEQIAQLLADGNTNPQISKELSLSVDTVKWHLKNIFQKLGVSNRTQAVIALTGQRSFLEDEF